MAAPARTYYCRWCGMESETADRCSWCRRDMRNLPAAGTQPHTVITRKAGPVRRPAPPRPVQPPPEPARPDGANGYPPRPAPAVPQIGTFQPQKSRYYSDKVFDPVSQAHYDADTGASVEGDVAPLEVEEVSEVRQLGIYATLVLALTVVAGAIGRTVPDVYLPLLGIVTFVACMAMPLLRVVPFGHDDASDLALAIALILLLGPFAGALAYGILGFMKQDVNPAIVGVFATYLVVRVGLDLSVGRPALELFSKMLPDLDSSAFAARWMPLAGLAGWFVADMFHNPDE